MTFKMTSLEKKWVLYDIANSAFTLLVSTIMPIYFNSLASNANLSEVDYLAYWGYATSAATLIVGFLGPVLGTFSDGQKDKIFPVQCSYRSDRMYIFGHHAILAMVPFAVHHHQISIFIKPGFL